MADQARRDTKIDDCRIVKTEVSMTGMFVLQQKLLGDIEKLELRMKWFEERWQEQSRILEDLEENINTLTKERAVRIYKEGQKERKRTTNLNYKVQVAGAFAAFLFALMLWWITTKTQNTSPASQSPKINEQKNNRPAMPTQ